MKRQSTLVRRLLSVPLLASLTACATVRDRPERPNIVVIVSDDLGYAQLSFNGATTVATPHLDALCGEGVYFTQAYVSSPACAPSRAGLMTSRYPARYGYESLTGPIERQIEQDIGVDTREIFLSQLLRDAGYATAAIGKWHLGVNERYHPNNRGFDYFFGFLAKGRYFWDDRTEGRGAILRNRETVEGEGYLTEVFADEAARFIRRSKGGPFFLYYAPWNIHTPHDVPARYVPPGGNVVDGMVRALDESVGVLLETLREEGLERNTLVVFLNDNGGLLPATNRPFRGGKRGLYEGGIRVPLALRWPAGLPAGETFERPVIQLDLLPTLLALAGGELPGDREYDGVNLLPHLIDETIDPPHESLFWRHVSQEGHVLARATRDGDLKLAVFPGQPGEPETMELYDLARDPGETRDAAGERPEDVRRLRQALETWEQRVREPARGNGDALKPPSG